MPTRRHQLPTIRVESRQLLRPQSFPNSSPELLLVLASVKGSREFRVVGADVPEEDSEGVNVYGIVVGTSKKFRCHVDGCFDNGTCHHGLRFAESKICEGATILIVKL